MLLAAVVVLGMLPVTAFAAEEEYSDHIHGVSGFSGDGYCYTYACHFIPDEMVAPVVPVVTVVTETPAPEASGEDKITSDVMDLTLGKSRS